jgi:hypothetical protein
MVPTPRAHLVCHVRENHSCGRCYRFSFSVLFNMSRSWAMRCAAGFSHGQRCHAFTWLWSSYSRAYPSCCALRWPREQASWWPALHVRGPNLPPDQCDGYCVPPGIVCALLVIMSQISHLSHIEVYFNFSHSNSCPSKSTYIFTVKVMCVHIYSHLSMPANCLFYCVLFS